eukprot:scaffold346_cov387-Prasinococcus_capsulatus_cf.AAC.22
MKTQSLRVQAYTVVSSFVSVVAIKDTVHTIVSPLSSQRHTGRTLQPTLQSSWFMASRILSYP